METAPVGIIENNSLVHRQDCVMCVIWKRYLCGQFFNMPCNSTAN